MPVVAVSAACALSSVLYVLGRTARARHSRSTPAFTVIRNRLASLLLIGGKRLVKFVGDLFSGLNYVERPRGLRGMFRRATD